MTMTAMQRTDNCEHEHKTWNTDEHKPFVQDICFDGLSIDSNETEHTVEASSRPFHQHRELRRAVNRDIARLKLSVSNTRRSSCEGAKTIYSAPSSPLPTSESWRRASTDPTDGWGRASAGAGGFVGGPQRCLSSPGMRDLMEGLQNPVNSKMDEDSIARGLATISTMEFDADSYSDDELAYLILQVFLELQLDQHLNITATKLSLLIEAVQKHMFDNPYHNWTHVADVFQASYALGLASGLMGRLSPLEQFALLISALCHDLEHPGVNNLTLVKSKPELCELYGESSTLEKHHSLRAFSLMLHREVELLSGMKTTTYYHFRDMVTKIILATDMGRHAEYCAKVKQLASAAPTEESTHQQEMEIIIKCADTSNVLRPGLVAKQWAVKIGAEFFAQGDLERSMGLKVTPTCDRKSQTLVGLQKGFIDFCIGPFFDSVAELWPLARDVMAQVWTNRAMWDAYDDHKLYSEMGYALPASECQFEME